MHPCAKSVGMSTLHVRLKMQDWSWNTRALQVSGEIPNVRHPWLWLVDHLADVCTGSDMFPNGSVLPVTLRKWTHSRSGEKPCTIRGVDWEVIKTRNVCMANKIVLKFPDWSSLMPGCSLKRLLAFVQIRSHSKE